MYNLYHFELINQTVTLVVCANTYDGISPQLLAGFKLHVLFHVYSVQRDIALLPAWHENSYFTYVPYPPNNIGNIA